MSQPGEIDLLFVDDDDDFRATVVRRFSRRGYRVAEAASGEDALQKAERQMFDVAIVDVVMPGMNGQAVLEKLRASQPECEVIMLTGQGSIESAVAAMKAGAYDYLTKPFRLEELERVLQKAHERRFLAKENRQLKAILQRAEPQYEMVGQSPQMQEVFRVIQRAGPSDNAILIQGDSGTGKELVARALHKASPRAQKPLVVFNCAAMPETLMESELYGHEKGAFTGAVNTKLGLFEVADGGTLMIDEIGEMPGSLQAKLLRVLEDGSMRRVGSLKERKVNVRLLVATNRDIAQEVKKGNFREDLYYRINVMSLQLPALRDREGDLPLLIEHFLGPQWTVDDEAHAALVRYFWPGNVRQLINAIERAKIMADDHIIHRWDLPHEVLDSEEGPSRPPAGTDGSLADIERAHVADVLRREGGNKARSARALGINRRSLYRLIDKYNIQPSEIQGEPTH